MIGNFKRYYRAMRLKASGGNMNRETTSVPVPIPDSCAHIREELQKAFHGSIDFKLLSFGGETALMAYLDGLSDKLLISDSVIGPLKAGIAEPCFPAAGPGRTAFLAGKVHSMCENTTLTDLNACIEAILSAETVLFADGDPAAICLNLQKFEKRGIEESRSEAVTRGSRQAFTETLSVNLTLMRRIIKNSNLVFENFKVGRQTKTNIAIGYLNGLANQEILDEVRKRLRNISADAILESGYVEESIEDSPFSIFPTVFNSERPDSVAGKVLEGRIAIFCDGTPAVLTVPCLFIDHLQFTEDYSNRWLFSGFIRTIRWTAFWISTTLPSLYIALLCFHQDVVPFRLLITISNSLNGIPFPPLLEMLAMSLLFEIIKESGLRMPSALGQAVSIVGGLIVGQAAVQAGLFSTAGVIVVATTSISAFITPKLETPIIIIRISLMFAASSLGILGILLASTAFFIHACSLKSFGVPYLSPITPLMSKDMKDVFIRIPIWAMFEKPESITRRYFHHDEND